MSSLVTCQLPEQFQEYSIRRAIVPPKIADPSDRLGARFNIQDLDAKFREAGTMRSL